MDLMNLVAIVIPTVATIYVTIIAAQFNRSFHIFTVGLDLSVRRLHRMQEALIREHEVQIKLLVTHDNKAPIEEFTPLWSEYSACRAELFGLSVAINDEKLSNALSYCQVSIELDGGEDEKINEFEKAIRTRAMAAHCRISELLEEAAHKDTLLASLKQKLNKWFE